MHKWLLMLLLLLLLLSSLLLPTGAHADDAEPLHIGDTFTLASPTLRETRRINVYRPRAWGLADDAALPVLYMPDGGLGEDFLHIAGLLQVSVGNGTMRPMLLVGIENTERRRDLTGPTESPEDRKIAPRVGGSAAFRTFLRDELIPEISRRYRTTDERAIVGESLAGLFVVETLLSEPNLFDTYIAFDPSLWWNDASLLKGTVERISALNTTPRQLYLATSSETKLAELVARLAEMLSEHAPPALRWQHRRMPEEQHATIYHPAALAAFRALFAPAPGSASQ